MAGCGTKENQNLEVVVYTYVAPGGQCVEDITVSGVNADGINLDDFSFKGRAVGWMDDNKQEFTAEISSVSAEENKLVFHFDSFPKKYYYVTDWKIENGSGDLKITSDQVKKVVTPVADEFTFFGEKDGEAFNYQFYVPAEAEEPMPIVVVFHGFSDYNNLLCYRTAVEWAVPANQEKRPCYILAPVIDDQTYFQGAGRDGVYEALYTKLQNMISEGKIDPKRIYIMGNSFGGMATVEFSEKYPDLPAAIMPLCSALNYSETAMNNLEKIINIPMRIAHAESDATIPVQYSKEMYGILEKAGVVDAVLRIYSDKEMNAVGCTADRSTSYNYHHVEIPVMQDETCLDWLYSQSK